MTRSQPAQHAYPWGLSLTRFLVAFALLQWGWDALRGSAIERVVVHDLVVGCTVAMIQWLTPEVGAVAHEASIRAVGGGLNILKGCEGTDVLFLLIAALSAQPLAWRVRLLGWSVGAVLVFALNELRLLALFYTYRQQPDWFDLLHGLIAPIALVALTLLFALRLLAHPHTPPWPPSTQG